MGFVGFFSSGGCIVGYEKSSGVSLLLDLGEHFFLIKKKKVLGEGNNMVFSLELCQKEFVWHGGLQGPQPPPWMHEAIKTAILVKAYQTLNFDKCYIFGRFSTLYCFNYRVDHKFCFPKEENFWWWFLWLFHQWLVSSGSWDLVCYLIFIWTSSCSASLSSPNRGR